MLLDREILLPERTMNDLAVQNADVMVFVLLCCFWLAELSKSFCRIIPGTKYQDCGRQTGNCCWNKGPEIGTQCIPDTSCQHRAKNTADSISSEYCAIICPRFFVPKASDVIRGNNAKLPPKLKPIQQAAIVNVNTLEPMHK